eukprot:9325788-Heterocapsa_arctica.AAC.1
MVSKVRASHANETHEEQKIRSATHFRHGVATVGFHIDSVRQSPHGDILALSLASTLALSLGLGLCSCALLSLVQDELDSLPLE